MEESKINQELSDLLEKATKGPIDGYTLTIHEGNKKGDGYLGEFINLTIKNKKTNQEIHLAIKQSTFDTSAINEAYNTEIYFYQVLWPKLLEFQNRFAPNLKGMEILPKCLATNSKTVRKRLVLENLKFQNFQIYDRTKAFDKDHMELVFKTYGKLHALSFAFKEKDFENYKNITKPFDDQNDIFNNIYMILCEPITRMLKNILEHYNGENKAEILNKISELAANTQEVYRESFFYNGNYSVVLHGDCWSNNMFFKYDVSEKPTEIRLIDLQLSRTASPVYDLSYAFYCGASKEILDDLNHYLKVYHESLSNVLKEFGCDSEVLYPFSVLTQEWKAYSKMGFICSLIIWAAKLMTGNIPTLGKTENNQDSQDDKNDKSKMPIIDQETYNRVTSDLLLHMYKNSFF